MKEYFYLNGKDPNGPFTIEQLTNSKLTDDTFIWTEGMENWQKIKDVPELLQVLKPKSVPPPPPIDTEKIAKTEVSGQLYVTTKKVKFPLKIPNWLIYWCVFHLFALFFSYSGIKYFNQSTCLKEGSWDTEEFWPFTSMLEFIDEEPNNLYGAKGWCGSTEEKYFGYYIIFRGIFYDYDITEFMFYVGGAIIIFFLVRRSNKTNGRKIGKL